MKRKERFEQRNAQVRSVTCADNSATALQWFWHQNQSRSQHLYSDQKQYTFDIRCSSAYASVCFYQLHCLFKLRLQQRYFSPPMAPSRIHFKLVALARRLLINTSDRSAYSSATDVFAPFALVGRLLIDLDCIFKRKNVEYVFFVTVISCARAKLLPSILTCCAKLT